MNYLSVGVITPQTGARAHWRAWPGAADPSNQLSIGAAKTSLLAGLGFAGLQLWLCFDGCAYGSGDGFELGLLINALGLLGPRSWPEKFKLLMDHPRLPVVGHVC